MNFKSKITISFLGIIVGILIYFNYANYYAKKLSPEDFIGSKDFYSQKIQPIFDSRCVACHSCYNAPCQLNLTSSEGLLRGASSINIYDFPKLDARDPTRLHIDAHNTEEWRKKGFFPVAIQNPNHSILSFLISEPYGIESGKQNKYASEESRICMKSLSDENIKNYSKANPAGRMPFGLPKLNDDEINLLEKWQTTSLKGPDTQHTENKILKHRAFRSHISSWEKFLNTKSIKGKIAARYIYEHLFLAHLYFEDQPNIFFRLVRSENKKGPIQELATVYPFDKPKSDFYYRLRPITNTLVHKSHIPFKLTLQKLNDWEKMFIESKWIKEPTKMPAYGRKGANPFTTFKDIPAEVKYRFFLEDAGYFVMTFIKGPVCRGQTALNVINDHFWVFFLHPNYDALVNSRDTYNKVSNLMSFPSEIKDDFKPMIEFKEHYWDGVKEKFKYYTDNNMAFNPNWIWNGDRINTNAVLTVYRHFDSAQVIRGLKGQTPKTVWVLDYQVFESIYYNLTAGYNVFGPVLHQLNSRLYMDISRIAAEDLFLTFLPNSVRSNIRQSWNVKTPDSKEPISKKLYDLVSNDIEEKMSEDYPYLGSNIKANFKPSKKISGPQNNPFFRKDLKDENQIIKQNLLSKMRSSFSETQLIGQFNSLKSNHIKDFVAKLREVKPEIISYLPDTILIKLHSQFKSHYFTLIHNKDHYNVGMIFFEDERRNPKNDSVNLLEGMATSYANVFMDLDLKQLNQFSEDLQKAEGEKDIKKIIKTYAVSRKSPKFWELYKSFSDHTKDKLTNEMGWLDLNRYQNDL